MAASRDAGQPPRDPETWTDEQWLAWLEATDEDAPGKTSTDPKRTRRRPTGALGAAMLGLRDALYGRVDDDVVIVADGGGDPPNDDTPLVHLDPEHPERSEVVVRRHRRHAAPP
jgi:hypothetical protein